MKLIDQVCTLEQAKRLNELKVVQGANAFYHNANSRAIEYNNHYENGAFYNAEFCFSAFTVAKLGQMLPYDTRSYQYDQCWQILYPDEGVMSLFLSEDCDTEAKIRCAFLIWLLETNAITAEEVNKRLLS